jgi:hypothetical protein
VPRVALLLALLCATASAGPARVVLADPDPALRKALVSSLRPWRIEIVIDSDAPTDDASAGTHADAHTARFVVWRDRDELVVFDRESNHSERRASRAGALDDLGAAAAALSVKTMLRLPPEPPPDIVIDVPHPPVAPPVVEDDGTELRFDAGAGGRGEYGLDGNLALRFLVAAAVRPWRDATWRFGVAGDFGAAAATVDQAGFHGTWSHWGVVATASWAHPAGAFELAPWLGVGVERSLTRGVESGTSRSEEDVLPAVRAGLGVRRGYIGVVLTLEGLVTTHTYTRLDGPAQVFEIPPIAASLSFILTADVVP